MKILIIGFRSLIVLFLVVTLGVDPTPAKPESQTVANLSFQADIYGSSSPENIDYLADLTFYNWGEWGVNAQVMRSNLGVSGDWISYAVSYAKPDVFTFAVAPVGSNNTITMTVSREAYPSGIVTAEADGGLQFVWDVTSQSPYSYHFKLHKHANLVTDQEIRAGRYYLETFSIENLGPDFDLREFSEILHMDDIARLRDYDNDSTFETILAVNNYTTTGYPIFGKVYLRRQGITTNFENDGKFATVNHFPLYRTFPTGSEQEVARAGYVIGITKSSAAEQDVAADAQYLLSSRPCEIQFFSQIDPDWIDESLPCEPPFDTIGGGGCTLSATASVLDTFGSATNPLLLNSCLGSNACPLVWGAVPACSGGTVTFNASDDIAAWNDANPSQSWNQLDTELNDNHQPVLMGMSSKTDAGTHWVLVVSGQGDTADDYRVHDPQYLCGANLPFANYAQRYNFDKFVFYQGVVGCSSLLTLTPLCVQRQSEAVPVLTGTELNQDSLVATPSSLISGDVVMFSATTLTMTVEVTATSSAGPVTDVQVWSDTLQGTQWQPFTSLLWLPLSDQVYARFRDDQSNISDIYSTTPFPTDPGNFVVKMFLPVIQ